MSVVVSGDFCRFKLALLHCHSCQKTKSRLHTPVSTVVRAEVQVVCVPKILPIGIFLSHTLRSFLGPRFTCLNLSTQRSVIIAPEVIFENEVNDSLFSFISHTVALHVLSKGKAPLSIFIIWKEPATKKILNILNWIPDTEINFTWGHSCARHIKFQKTPKCFLESEIETDNFSSPSFSFSHKSEMSDDAQMTHLTCNWQLELNCTNQELRLPANGILQKNNDLGQA